MCAERDIEIPLLDLQEQLHNLGIYAWKAAAAVFGALQARLNPPSITEVNEARRKPN